MATINPNLASAALTLQNIQNGSQLKPMEKSAETQSSERTNPVSGNSSFTLSEPSESMATDYLALNNQQTVNQTSPSEDAQNKPNEMTNGLTYASNLETQSNYLANSLNNK